MGVSYSTPKKWHTLLGISSMTPASIELDASPLFNTITCE